MSLNIITLMGRFVSDPTLRFTQSQKPVASFTLAVDRDYNPGEKETDFVNCVAWNKTAEFIDSNFSKGKMAIVTGRLQSRQWMDKENKKHIEWEVVADRIYFGESRKKEEPAGDSPFPPGVTGRVDKSKFQEMNDSDGDLPF